MRRFYLDNAATTQMISDATREATKYLSDEFYNPNAIYDQAIKVRRVIDDARSDILSALGGQGRLIFTGSATEANNMACFSIKNFKGKVFLFGAGEHPSVSECAKELLSRGAEVQFVPLNETGSVDIEKYKSLLTSKVAFISIQHVSNETGAVNDIERLVKLAKKVNPDVIFHSDGVQAFLKMEYSVDALGVDMYTVSAHKVNGPKGIGALYVRKGLNVSRLIFGGGQEDGLRSGTENVFNIVGFKEAVNYNKERIASNHAELKRRRDELLSGLNDNKVKYQINGEGLPSIMSIWFDQSVRGETLLHALERRGIYVSTGSACSANKHFNATLEAMGKSKEIMLASIRISLSPYLDFDGKEIAKIMAEEIQKIKERNYG